MKGSTAAKEQRKGGYLHYYYNTICLRVFRIGVGVNATCLPRVLIKGFFGKIRAGCERAQGLNRMNLTDHEKRDEDFLIMGKDSLVFDLSQIQII